MRTTTTDFDTLTSREFGAAATDLGFDSIPRALRAEGRASALAGGATRGAAVVRRSVPDRRPCRARVQPVSRERARRDHVIVRHAPGRARGAHPLQRMQRAQAGLAALAVTALMSALAVTGLIALAQLRSGDFDSPTPPSSSVQHVPQLAPAGVPIR
ncbi:hypothetical protein [Nocardia sp. NBC_00511]|uniref:hypothetical protein n=1 Tax=Nocardia sp. NBC_00511 TaxID=2903591 RepID=UPI0030DE7FC9